MYYLGQKIVKAMQDAGYPAKIVECYRDPRRQAELKAKGYSKASPWNSPHQYYEAVDIVHPGKGWDVSEAYWDTLAVCVDIVAAKYGVELEHGHGWRFRDSAHIELKDWRAVRKRHRAVLNSAEESQNRGRVRPDGTHLRPNEQELWARFAEVLPEEAKRVKPIPKKKPAKWPGLWR